MAFLRREGEYADVPRPDLILLDMNLPKKNGRKVLEEIKQSLTGRAFLSSSWLALRLMLISCGRMGSMRSIT
jgi:CheY-like chemotaxis protein